MCSAASLAFEKIASVATETERNRLDHILPQGYLEGFTIPSKQGRLCVFDIKRRRWFESSPVRVAAQYGYYDYSESSEPEATADQAFAEFEVTFPPLVRELVARNFSGWERHIEFLVRYAQMLRARSDLFRQEVMNEASNATFLKVEEILSGNKIRYTEMDIRNDPARDTCFKNMSITKMRAEIEKGAGFFAGWNWHLRLTDDVANPVITADNPITLIGFGATATREEALNRHDTLLMFPVCWQACLVASQQEFEERASIPPEMQERMYRLYLNQADGRFAYSPHPVGC
jgi:hypothetical protein